MTSLNMIVEGQTEETFVNGVLKGYLAERGVMVFCQCVESSRKKGRIHKGGLSRYEKPKTQLQRWMKQDGRSDVRFTTMFDLYALPNDFPEYAAAKGMSDPFERVEKLEEAFRGDIADHRFIPYIQLHEFEALILSEPSKFSLYFLEDPEKVEALTELCEGFESPELIDDGATTAPSKRIIDKLPQYADVKATAGPMIAEGIGIDKIRSRCRHFGEWLAKLEGLAAA